MKRAARSVILAVIQLVKRGLTVERNIELSADDPTIWAKCPRCTRYGVGVVTGDYYARAFSKKKWGKGNKTCPNCETRLEFMYEVK